MHSELGCYNINADAYFKIQQCARQDGGLFSPHAIVSHLITNAALCQSTSVASVLLMSELMHADVKIGCFGALQVAWKNHLHMLHPSPAAYAAYMGDVAM